MAILNGFIIAGLLLGPVPTGWAKEPSHRVDTPNALKTAAQTAKRLVALKNLLRTFPGIENDADSQYILYRLDAITISFEEIETAKNAAHALSDSKEDLITLREELEALKPDTGDDNHAYGPDEFGPKWFIYILDFLYLSPGEDGEDEGDGLVEGLGWDDSSPFHDYGRRIYEGLGW